MIEYVIIMNDGSPSPLKRTPQNCSELRKKLVKFYQQKNWLNVVTSLFTYY
jgi:hypothetical protein